MKIMLKSAKITKKINILHYLKYVKCVKAHVKNNIFASILLNQAFLLIYVHKKIKKINICII